MIPIRTSAAIAARLDAINATISRRTTRSRPLSRLLISRISVSASRMRSRISPRVSTYRSPLADSDSINVLITGDDQVGLVADPDEEPFVRGQMVFRGRQRQRRGLRDGALPAPADLRYEDRHG